MSFYFGFNSSEEQEKRRKADLQAIGKSVTEFFWDVAPAHGFEMREGQQDMSFEIIDALIHNQHFAVEAGVGIGKSFGYLVPVLLYNKKMKKPVIVATSTIALQEQLWNDVHDVMPLLNTQPEVILAKGQTHYLCHKRANEYINMEDAVIPKELTDGIEQGFQERKQFSSSLPQSIWDKVNIQRFSMRNCGSCEKKCLYYAIRSQLRYTKGIVLCNQDFLTAHLRQLRRGQDGLINREADLIVVDEAHNLDDKVRSATTERVNQSKILGLIQSATKEIKSADRQNVYRETNEAQRRIRTFFDSLKAQMQQQISNSRQDMRYADRFFFDGSLESINLLKSMCIEQLRLDGVSFFKNSSKKLYQHIVEINRLISDRINNCKKYFPLWLNWQYVKELFIMPDGLQESGTKAAASLYYQYRACYPYQVYMNWAPKDEGNVLYNDKKFVTLLYQWHDDYFTEYSKVSDAGSYIKGSIYEFIATSEKVVLVVDCENSDPYKLCATLKSLDYQHTKKIASIILFDDVHTASAWRILESFTKIPVEHILIERVKQNKSLVDIMLTARACQEHYKNNVDSFVIVSSDSDYWGLISSLSEARFLVMIERGHSSPDLRNALLNAGIFYCYIDDFYSGDSEDIKMSALAYAALQNQLDRRN